MATSQSEVESLRRRVNALTQNLSKVYRDHRREIGLKDVIIQKKMNRQGRLEKTIAALARDKFFNDSQATKINAQKHEIEQLQKELSRACKENDIVKNRLMDMKMDMKEAISKQPGATLRLQIKHLCVKYHSDKRSESTVPSDEVARDLIQLLSL